MMEQWNDVQEKRGSDAEHRNQDKKEVPNQDKVPTAEHRNQDNTIFHHSSIPNGERSELSSFVRSTFPCNNVL